METNEITDKLPLHLKQFIIEQPYNSYTSIDHAVWRYVMRQNIHYLEKVADKSYLEGLQKTGIDTENIPGIEGMNKLLKNIGWAAVTVDGFIPPAAFMEFQAHNVLVIAADIRTIEHIEYTPAPDIIHEAAGHAPIIANSKYAHYLKFFGEVGSKAFSSKNDYKLYEAIRHLSIIKENPHTTEEEVREGEKIIAEIQLNMGAPSEMARLRNLHWWTVEYGLIGTLDNYRIYGAGLLSSIGESVNCMKPSVKKLLYSIDAANYNFDITTQQPQLFVTPDFQHLSDVLNEFLNTMAIKRGGAEGINKAIASENTATCIYSSLLQVSGTFTEYIADKQNQPIYIQTKGPTALAVNNKQLQGHGKKEHTEGFGSPTGKLKACSKPIEEFTDAELKLYGFKENYPATLEFESGLSVKGTLNSITRSEARKIILMTFDNCEVVFEGKILFHPSWGKYDMAVGEKIISVFSGAADTEAFLPTIFLPKEKTHKIVYDEQALILQDYYRKVRNIRQSKSDYENLFDVWKNVQTKYPNDWLLSLEVLEIFEKERIYPDVALQIKNYLSQKAATDNNLFKLIQDGLNYIQV